MNDKRLGPTFVTVRGSSSIDVTLSRGIEVLDWKRATLSGHKHIQYELELEEGNKPQKRIYDFVNTDWEDFAERLEEGRQQLNIEEHDIDKKHSKKYVKKHARLAYVPD